MKDIIVRALIVLQKANLDALNTGEGRGHTTLEMADILDRELGFTELVEALSELADGTTSEWTRKLAKARAALAKATGRQIA